MHGGSALQHPYPTRPPTPSTLPDDFSDRLVRFKEASGLSWRALARELGVNPYRLREWRRGVTPTTPHLLHLLGLAEQFGLGDVLARQTTNGFEEQPAIDESD